MQHESKKEKAKKLSNPYRAGEANGLTASNKVRPPVPKQGKSNVRRRQKHTYTDNPVLPSILAPPLRCPKNPKQKHTDEKSNKPKRLSTSPPGTGISFLSTWLVGGSPPQFPATADPTIL
jgi:hypothetical protein